MRFVVLSILALAPSAAFACAMYIPSEELKQAMADVDQAAKPVPVAQAPVQAPAPAPPQADAIPEAAVPSEPGPPPTSAAPAPAMIPEVAVPAS